MENGKSSNAEELASFLTHQAPMAEQVIIIFTLRVRTYVCTSVRPYVRHKKQKHTTVLIQKLLQR